MRSAYVSNVFFFLAPSRMASGNLLLASANALFDLTSPLSTILKALKISAETFRASIAVNTKYMILIINCLGCLGIDIIVVYSLKKLRLHTEGTKHVSVYRIERGQVSVQRSHLILVQLCIFHSFSQGLHRIIQF